jgi:arylsulfatase A-like enzyme
MQRLVVLEFNELTPALMDRFIDEGVLPNFRRLRDESIAYVTDAEEDQQHLNPWVQWPTVHTGASYAEHGVLKLGEGSALTQPTVADVVAEAGGRSWICGSMNLPVRSGESTWYLPDPWAPDAAAYPAVLEPISNFVRAHVQEHSNLARRGSPGALKAGLAFARLRPSVSTAAAVVGQLAGERTGRHARWERAAVLDRIQWDVFRWGWRRHRPDFATFFSNSTAHFQHVYWRHHDPERFELPLSDDERARYGDAIRLGYRQMDALVGRALALVGSAATLVFCSALGQQPYLKMEAEGGKKLHRPYRIDELMAAIGIDGITGTAPVMAEQFHLYFSTEADAERAVEKLDAATLNGVPAFTSRRNGTDVLTGCAVLTDVSAGAEIDLRDGRSIPFHQLLYQLETTKSGYHHPLGLLWVRTADRRGARIDEPVPLRSVAPTLLSLLGLPPSTSMTAPALATTASTCPPVSTSSSPSSSSPKEATGPASATNSTGSAPGSSAGTARIQPPQ